MRASHRYPLPNMQDLNSRLAGCKVFSKLDLVTGYHQVPVAAADVPKTAVITPFGLFEYLYMPFGLKNASQSFQRLMDRTFSDQHSVFVYLDDNLAATATVKEHLQILDFAYLLIRREGILLTRRGNRDSAEKTQTRMTRRVTDAKFQVC